MAGGFGSRGLLRKGRSAALRFVIDYLKFLFLFIGQLKNVSLKLFDIALILGRYRLDQIGQRRILIFPQAAHQRIERQVKRLHAEQPFHAVLHVIRVFSESVHFRTDGTDLPAGGIELRGVGIGSALGDPFINADLFEHGEQAGGMLCDAFEGVEHLRVRLGRDLRLHAHPAGEKQSENDGEKDRPLAFQTHTSQTSTDLRRTGALEPAVRALCADHSGLDAGLNDIGSAFSTCDIPHSRGALSGRQRISLVP